MRWLITTSADTDIEALQESLQGLDCQIVDDPIPLGPHEQVIEATGPADLAERVAESALPITKVSPDSEVTLY